MTSEAERLRELLTISRAITGTTDYGHILELVVAKARSVVEARACVLLLAEPGAEAKVLAAAGVPKETTGAIHTVLDERIGARLHDQLHLARDEAIVAVPMVVAGRLRGILAVVHRRGRGAAPLEGEEYLLSALADQAAIALGHAAHVNELEAALSDAERERRERAALLEELTNERGWLRAVIEHSPVAIMLAEGPAGARVTANPRAVQLFGRSFDSSAGIAQYGEQVCTPDGTPLEKSQLPAIAAIRGEVVNRELAIRRPDGSVTPVLASAAAIRQSHGKILGAVVLYEDISALKALERTREEWTSIVAHDLRQPVAAISLHAQRLARDALEDVRAHAEHILFGAKRLQRMIGDLLDVSLIEAEHLELDRRACAPGEMLRDIVQRYASALGDHQVELVAPEGLPQVHADSGRVEQIVANLLSNAVKYGAPGTPIEVRAEDRGEMVELTVKNYGAGITREGLATLFQRFRRGQTRGARGHGLGVGLYICKGIVEAHGGKLWAESVADEWTAFHFTLPVSRAEHAG